jgi:AAA domain
MMINNNDNQNQTQPLPSPTPTTEQLSDEQLDLGRWLIMDILPKQLVSLVAGPSGSGKTRWLMKTLVDAWSKGQPVFEHASYPVPYVYCSADRSRRSYAYTFRKMGLNPPPPSFSSWDLNHKTLDATVAYATRNFPEARLLVIEGFGGLVPGGKMADYTAVRNFLNKASLFCEQYDITIIGVLHSPKMKAGEEYLNPRQRILGSVAWAAFSETCILIEPSGDPDKLKVEIRNLFLLPRDAKSQHFEMAFNDQGLVVEVPQDRLIEPPPDFGLDSVRSRILGQLWRSGIVPGGAFKYELFPQTLGARSKVQAELAKLITEKLVKRIDRGSYKLLKWPEAA